MKIPFDIEKAKAGAQVVTRAGEKAQILMFNGKFPGENKTLLVVVAEQNSQQKQIDCAYYYTDKGQNVPGDSQRSDDLFLEVEPEYKPFDLSNAPVGKTVTRKETQDKSLIVFADNTLVGVGRLTYSYEYLFQYFTFKDGSPCGVLAS